MEQKLTVNCATCDARTVAEETLQTYEKITVNCSNFLVSPKAKALIGRYPVSIRCGKVLMLDPEVVLKTVNGSAVIAPGPAPAKPLYFTVNGSLTIEPGAEEALSGYVGIAVNGSLLAPKSLESTLPTLSLNGSADYYPDGAILLKRTTAVDHLFPLRAKVGGLYWTSWRLMFLDSALDPQVLAEKQVRFSASNALILQSLAEGVVPLLTDETEIDIVPDGMQVIRDDVTLTPDVPGRYGSRLYILGDLTLTQESEAVLPRMEQFIVKGSVRLPKSLAEAFSRIPAEYRSLELIRGRTLADRPLVRLTRSMLESDPDGLTIMDCAQVWLDPDIPEQLILEKLSLSDCVQVLCSQAQQGAVTLVSQDVEDISTGDEAESTEAVSKDPQAPRDPSVKVINASDYVL